MRRWKVWIVALALLALPALMIAWALSSASDRLRRVERETSEEVERLHARPSPAILNEFRHPRVDWPRDYAEGIRSSGPDWESGKWGYVAQGVDEELRARRPDAALRRILCLIALYAEAARETEAFGIAALPRLHRPFRRWESAIRDPSLSAAELRTAARALEELERALPTAFDVFRVQHLLERFDVLRAARGKSTWASEAEPRWIHLKSRDLLSCSLLSALEREHAELMDLERRPSPERVKAARALSAANPPLVDGRPWLGGAEALLILDVSRLQVSLMRLSATLRATELETGRPAKLTERLLCPFTGAPVRYENGKLWAPGPDFDDDGGRAPTEEGDDEADGDVVLRLR